METVYRVVWKPCYKELGINTNHIIRTMLYADQGPKDNYKEFLLI